MEILTLILNFILKVIFSVPFVSSFFGAFFAFKFNNYQMQKIKKDEHIANLNYLTVTLDSYLSRMDFLQSEVEKKLELIKTQRKIPYHHIGVTDDNMSIIRDVITPILYAKTPITLNFANYSFANKDISFITSIIYAVNCVEDVKVNLRFVENYLKGFIINDNQIDLEFFFDCFERLTDKLRLLREKVFRTIISISECRSKLIDYNKQYLNYKLAEISLKEDYKKLFTKARSFMGERSKKSL